MVFFPSLNFHDKFRSMFWAKWTAKLGMNSDKFSGQQLQIDNSVENGQLINVVQAKRQVQQNWYL